MHAITRSALQPEKKNTKCLKYCTAFGCGEWKLVLSLPHSVETIEDFIKKIDSVKPENVDFDDGIRNDLLLLKADLESYITGTLYKGWHFPINFMEGIHVDMHTLISYMKFENKDDFKKYEKRLACYPDQISQVIGVLKIAVKNGHTNHQVSMEGVREQLKELLSENLTPKESCFLSPFASPPKTIPEETLQSLLVDVIQVLKKHVLPAFQELAEFLENVYMKNLRTDISVQSIPKFDGYYQQCLNFHLSVVMTPEEIFNLGMKEVERIQKAMHKITEAEGFGTDIKRFNQYLKERENFTYKTGGELVSAVEEMCFQKIHPSVSKLFNNIPKSQLMIKPAPEHMASSPVGCYYAGSFDGSRPGVYYINTAKVHALPRHTLMALSLHEGEPGHHLQIMHAMSQKGLPKFRQNTEDMRYSYAPSRFPLHTAYIEGWGLYAEFLGEELGMYEDTYSLFGRYCFEIHRAARLVVDPGMHSMGWSVDEAVKYLCDTALMEEKEACDEARRYVTWPGQACAYKIGELKIRELRKKAEKQLGDEFKVQDFHEAVLKCGPASLSVLETVVDDYIQGAQS
ncbi:hypothetical protein ScPMuIL_011151 [Solemya velum]